MTTLQLVPISTVDPDAIEIGNLYRKGKSLTWEGMDHLAQAGQRLTEKKASLAHGEWLPWLEANKDVLGFENRTTASRLMALGAKWCASASFDDQKLQELNRTIWGHDQRDSELVQQSLSNEHYTPTQYIEAARAVLGQIDLDPASCATANRVVKAKRYFSENGQLQSWRGKVWLNPPYGRDPGPAPFIAKLKTEITAGNVLAAIVLVNAHCTDADWFQNLWDGVLCFTHHRINFYGDDERSGSTHGSVFVYFGSAQSLFVRHFEVFGAVVRRVQYDDQKQDGLR